MDEQKQIEEMAQCKNNFGVTCGECYTSGCERYKLAEELYKAGYRKIPEGAVVLTDDNEIKQYEWSKMLDKMGFFKFADNLRKETAEKFAERLKRKGTIFTHYDYNDYLEIGVDDIDEICKEIIGDEQ